LSSSNDPTCRKPPAAESSSVDGASTSSSEEDPLPGHVIIVIFIQFPAEEELEIFTVGQEFIIL
jgi:hypothetical protein